MNRAQSRATVLVWQIAIGVVGLALWQWGVHVGAYAFLLATDRYPPFSLTP